MRRRHITLTRAAAVAVLVAALAGGCVAAPPSADGDGQPPANGDGHDRLAHGDALGEPASGDELGAPGLQLDARVHDGYLEVLGRDGATVASLPSSVLEGEAVHAVVRPGRHDLATVLALVRVEGPELAAHYELRYVTVDDEGSAALSWFPWRLQVHAELVEVLDVAPVPVWSPDGGALAWIDWDRDDTILRIVRWHDGLRVSEPSELVASYRLRDVVPGTQLDAWHEGDPTVFTATGPDGERLEIELVASEVALQL